MYVAARGDVAVIELLLKYGANPNIASESEGETALHWAWRNGNTDAVAVLLEYGANPSIVNHTEETASALALANQHYETVALLFWGLIRNFRAIIG